MAQTHRTLCSPLKPLTANIKLTNSFFTISQMRGDYDPSFLPHAQPLQGFVHPLDHVALADVGIVGAVTPIAAKGERQIAESLFGRWLIYFLKTRASCSPRVEERAVLEGADVVVADVISSHRCARAAFGHLPLLHSHIILGVKDVDHQHLKHQRSLRWDLGSCVQECNMFSDVLKLK